LVRPKPWLTPGQNSAKTTIPKSLFYKILLEQNKPFLINFFTSKLIQVRDEVLPLNFGDKQFFSNIVCK